MSHILISLIVRLIFFGSEAGLGSIVLTLVSLFPRLLEQGLYFASGQPEPETTVLDENVNDCKPETLIDINNEDAISHKSIRSGQ